MNLMHQINLDPTIVERVKQRRGRLHAYESLEPTRTALIVIDMQNIWLEEGQPAQLPYGQGIVPNINRLARAVRTKGGRVVWVKMHHTAEVAESWSNYMDFFGAGHMTAMNDGLKPGNHGARLWHEMDVRPGDETVIKTRYSAFIQGSSDLEARLRSLDVDTLLITGVGTSVCCESTARDATMLNFKTIMVADANATASDYAHNASLNLLFGHFADVYLTDEVIALLQGAAKAAAE